MNVSRRIGPQRLVLRYDIAPGLTATALGHQVSAGGDYSVSAGYMTVASAASAPRRGSSPCPSSSSCAAGCAGPDIQTIS